MTSNNADWEKGWFYLRNDGTAPLLKDRYGEPERGE
jgi:hypothetical protein